MKPGSLQQIVNGRLCIGCGACAFVSEGRLEMRDLIDQGWRPTPLSSATGDLPAACLSVCPAAGTMVPGTEQEGICRDSLAAGLGPVVGAWEVHAGDPALRARAASGGALSALAGFALEQGGMAGVLHIAQDPLNPFRNRTVMSRSRAELFDRSGSRYAPASLCERLDLVEAAGGPCAVIGQPSEIAALRKVEALRPGLKDKVGITMSFFCAGSPSMEGTIELIRSRGIDPGTVTAVRYRGRGWPGNFAVWVKGHSEPVLEMTYAESWDFLQRYRPWSVHVWPDGAGEHADISCGDPWYRKLSAGEAGSSLVLARTARGREFVEAAIEAGFLIGGVIRWQEVAKSQENLLNKKGSIAGRLFAMKILGLPVPKHVGYRLWPLWRKLSAGDKARSVFGTMRRILKRGYHRPADWWSAVPVPGRSDKEVSPATATSAE